MYNPLKHMSSENSKHCSESMSLGFYLANKAEIDKILVEPGMQKKYVTVRTHCGDREIFGIVERTRLSDLLKATSSAAYSGSRIIEDPDSATSIQVVGPGSSLSLELQQQILTMMGYPDAKPDTKIHKHPGETLFYESTTGDPISYDKLAMLHALNLIGSQTK